MTTTTDLHSILDAVRHQAAVRRHDPGFAELLTLVRPATNRRGRFLTTLARPELGLIAEVKRRSPSAGPLSTEEDLLPRATAYASGGAVSLSILTEEDHFGGSLTDLRRAGDAGLPVLRKDFILDEGMVLESVAFGADAILLIVACLDRFQLSHLRQLAREYGLAVLVEVHDESELETALSCQPDCVGVNARDLHTGLVDVRRVEQLLPLVPATCVRIAESGLSSIADLQRVQAVGADAALVGTALMRTEDPTRLLRQWNRQLFPARTGT